MTRISAPKQIRTGRLWFAVLFFGALMNPLMMTGPLFMLQVYDRVIPSQSGATLAALFVLAAFLYAMMALLDSARIRVLVRIAAKFRAALDRPVFEARMFALIRDPGHSATLGALQDLDMVHKAIASSAVLSVLDTLWAFAFFGILFLLHPALGLVALGGGLILISLAFWGQWRTRKPLAEAHQAFLRADRQTMALSRDAEAVVAMGMSDVVADRWQVQRGEALSATLRAQDRSGVDGAVARAFRMMMQSAILGVGAWLVLQGKLSPGLIMAASILMGRALAPVEQLATQWPDLRAALAAWRRIEALLEAEKQLLPKGKPRDLPLGNLVAQGIIVMPRGGGAPILRIKGFEISSGSAVGVIGPSGSGKTTLARILIGSMKIAAGAMRLGDVALPLPPDSGRALGYLPQGVTLLDGTVGENIARFNPEATQSTIEKAARAAGIHEMIIAMPQGYDTLASGPDARLSGGQAQRVALARALYGDPTLVILDEPNSHQDSPGQTALNNAIRDLKARGAVVLVMAQRPAAISECENLLVFDNGAQVAFGPRDKVLRDMVRNRTSLVHHYVEARK